MRQFAGWLTGRFLNAVMAIAALFPIAPPLSAAVCVLLALKHGVARAALSAAIAGLALAALAPLRGIQPQIVLAYVSSVLGLGIATGYLLLRTRSATLTAQLSLIIVLCALALFSIFGPEPETLWGPALETLNKNMQASGMALDRDMLHTVVAPLMSAFVAGTTWIAIMLTLYLGYGLYGLLPDESFRYGRFRDLNLGRVVAASTVVVSVAAMLTDSPMPAGLASVLLLAFVLQGLALSHWLVDNRGISPILLLTVYGVLVLTPLRGILLLLLSVIGYIDAWFDLRSRLRPRTA